MPLKTITLYVLCYYFTIFYFISFYVMSFKSNLMLFKSNLMLFTQFDAIYTINCHTRMSVSFLFLCQIGNSYCLSDTKTNNIVQLTDRLTDRQTGRQTDRQTDIHTYIHTDIHTYRQAGWLAYCLSD